MEVAGLATGVIGSILQSEESRKRFRAMKQAARKMMLANNANFNTAASGIRGAQSAWENDPGRATLRDLWAQKLAHPDVIDPAQLSLMKAQGYDSAQRNSGQSISRLREQAQRAGIGGSRAGLGLEAGVRMNASSRNAGISNDLDLAASKANTANRDATRAGYAEYTSDENATRSGYAQQLASLYGSRQMGESDLLAFMN